MVAVNQVTLLAFSLVSLSLSPSADAAAIHARSSPSDPGSPSKPPRMTRQNAPTIPMPLKMMVNSDSPSKHQRGTDAMSKKSKFHKSRVVEANTLLGEASLKRQQEQARFHIKARQDTSGTPGHVDITNGQNKTMGHLELDRSSNGTCTLNASPTNMTTLYLEPLDSNHCALRVPIIADSTRRADSSDMCATFNPCPSDAQPLRVEPCYVLSDDPTPANSSQTFAYDSNTGVISPEWTCETTSSNNGTTDGPTSATLNSRDTPQNVTLVFVPNSAKVQAQKVGEQEVSPDSQSASSAATETKTITTTVTATPSFAAEAVGPASSTASASSQSTSFSADRFLSSTSSTPGPSFAAADFDAASSQPTSSSSPTVTSAAPASSSAAPSVGVLAVEVAPAPSSDPAASTSAGPSASSSDSSVPSASSSDSSVPSASLADSRVSSAPSSDSSAPSATPSTIGAEAVPADDIAFSSGSASATASSSSSASASNSASAADAAPSVAAPANDEQEAVYVGNARQAGTPQWR